MSGNKLAAFCAKFGRDGLGTLSFKAADKVTTYTLTVFNCDGFKLTGFVTKVKKVGKKTDTDFGIAEIF